MSGAKTYTLDEVKVLALKWWKVDYVKCGEPEFWTEEQRDAYREGLGRIVQMFEELKERENENTSIQ